MPQLPDPEEGPPCGDVAKGHLDVGGLAADVGAAGALLLGLCILEQLLVCG